MLIGCPEKWRLRYLQKVKESTGVDKWIGIVDHNTHAENLSQKVRTGGDLPATEMHTIYDETWDRELSDVLENEGEPNWIEEADSTRSHGHLMMSVYHELVSPTVKPIAVETRFEERFPGVPIPIIGYVDVEEKGRLIERKTTKTRMSKPKPNWLLQGRLYSMVFAKPVEWQIVTRAKAPSICLPETEPELRLEAGNVDNTVMLVEQATHMLNDLYLRYGPDRPWPALGMLHPFMCGYCFAGPKANFKCIAWKESE